MRTQLPIIRTGTSVPVTLEMKLKWQCSAKALGNRCFQVKGLKRNGPWSEVAWPHSSANRGTPHVFTERDKQQGRGPMLSHLDLRSDIDYVSYFCCLFQNACFT